jgi:hypothetical protein
MGKCCFSRRKSSGRTMRTVVSFLRAEERKERQMATDGFREGDRVMIHPPPWKPGTKVTAEMFSAYADSVPRGGLLIDLCKDCGWPLLLAFRKGDAKGFIMCAVCAEGHDLEDYLATLAREAAEAKAAISREQRERSRR